MPSVARPTALPEATPTRLLDPTPVPRRAGPGGPGPSEDALQAVRQAGRRGVAAMAVAAGVDPGAGSQASGRGARTVSRATLDQYRRRGNLLFERYRRELDIRVADEGVSPVQFANWALSLKPGLSASAWRSYRQAVMHFLEGFPGYEADAAIQLIEADVIDGGEAGRNRAKADKRQVKGKTAAVRSLSSAGDDRSWLNEGDPDGGGLDAAEAMGQEPDDDDDSAESRKRTSALKEKRFPHEDMDRVLAYLRSFCRSKLAPVLVDWLRAGIMTGLRPVEWRCSDLVEVADPNSAYGRRAFLYVLNAKATNGRGTGVARTLDLSAFPDDALEVVRRMSGRARGWLEDGSFPDRQAACSALLYATCRKIWPTRKYGYALYSTRHQAIANWKSMMPVAEIAAIVGHGVTSTATAHYGKKRSAWSPEKIPAAPRPVPEELSVVKQRVKLWEQRIEMEKRAGLRPEGGDTEFPVG